MKQNDISRVKTCFEFLGILLMIWLLCLHPEFIAIYRIDQGELTAVTPLFNEMVLSFYHPLILAVYGVGLILSCLKFIFVRWTMALAIGNLIYEVGGFLLLNCLLMNRSLFNEQFFHELIPFLSLNIMAYWSSIIFVTLAVIAIITFFNIIAPFIKLLRNL